MQTQSDFLVSHRPFQGFQDLLQVLNLARKLILQDGPSVQQIYYGTR